MGQGESFQGSEPHQSECVSKVRAHGREKDDDSGGNFPSFNKPTIHKKQAIFSFDTKHGLLLAKLGQWMTKNT